jgi:hypothetical protein
MYSRHYRYNPLFTNPTVSNVADPLHINFFDSILKARAFLIQVSCLTPKQQSDPQMQAKIEVANKIVAKADRRNDRRKARRATQNVQTAAVNKPLRVIAGGKQPTIYSVKNCKEAQQSVEKLCDNVTCKTAGRPQRMAVGSDRVNWEEVLDPDGNIVRFKIIYHKDGPDAGKVKERKRVKKEEPKTGDIVLDLTSGIRAWRIGKTREKIDVTKEMEVAYKASTLYKVRQLAAGFISLSQLVDALNKDLPSNTSKASSNTAKASVPRILQGGSRRSHGATAGGRRAARRPEKPKNNRNRPVRKNKS